jgi:hypothetical protein
MSEEALVVPSQVRKRTRNEVSAWIFPKCTILSISIFVVRICSYRILCSL